MGKIPISGIESNSMIDITLFAKHASLPQLWDMDVLGIKDHVVRKS